MIDIDEIDERILRTLATHGRISNLDLSGRVHLSPSACLRRVQELERRGVIRGYRAVFGAEALGIGFVSYVLVGLSKHTKQALRNFEKAISRAKEVRECHSVTGTFEYILRVEAADLAAYKHFHTEVLGVLPQVNSINTYVVMESPKDERA